MHKFSYLGVLAPDLDWSLVETALEFWLVVAVYRQKMHLQVPLEVLWGQEQQAVVTEALLLRRQEQESAKILQKKPWVK